MYRRPTAFITRRVFKLHGVTINKATTLTRAQVDLLGARITSLVSNGTIQTNPDLYGRRGVHGPKPTYPLPGLRPSTTLSVAVDGTTPKKRNFVARPVDAYVFDFGDGNNAVADADGTVSHTYAAAGIYDVKATADYQSVTVEDVVVTNLAVSVNVKVASFTATPAAAGPFTFVWGDGTANVVDADGVVSHTYATADTHTASVTCAGTSQVSTVSVVTT